MNKFRVRPKYPTGDLEEEPCVHALGMFIHNTWYRIDKIILISVLIYRSIHEVIKPPDYILRLTLDHGYMLVVPNQNHALLWACSC